MFARVYTAPPPKVLFDMYENDISFDEAARNLYTQELEQGFDTESLDEFLDPGIDSFDDDAVEKAIYQTTIAQEQGGNPVDITTTPYGAGLLQDEYDEVVNRYPGIGAGMEWRTMDDHYHDAEDVIKDPRAGRAIDHMVDSAVSRAEDEGSIDSLGDLFKAFGNQLATASQGVSEAHVASRTEVDPDTGELFLGPSIGPNTDEGTKNTIAMTAEEIDKFLADRNVSQEQRNWAASAALTGEVGSTAQPQPTITPSPQEVEEILNQGQYPNPYGAPQKQDSGPGSYPGYGYRTDIPADQQAVAALETLFLAARNAKDPSSEILKDIHDIFTAGTGADEDFDTGVFSAAVLEWMEGRGWEDKMENTGGNPEVVKAQLLAVFGERGTQDTTPWATDEWKSAEAVQSAERKAADRNLAIVGLMKEKCWDRADAEKHFDEMDPDEKTTYIEDMQALIPAEGEMRTRHNRSLSRSFYETVYAQPWGGNAEFASILPTMLSETKTLFFIANAIPGIDGLTERYGQDPPKEGDWGAEYKAGDDYKKFVRGYLQNPDAYRKGGWLAGRVKRINELLQKKRTDPTELPEGELYRGKWSEEDIKDWAWIQPLFAGETSNARTNRYNLMAMVASQGKQGYMANIVKAGTMRAIQHYENMGLGDSEIFSMMTRIFGDTGGRSAEPIPIGQDDALAKELDETAGVIDPNRVRDDVAKAPVGTTATLMDDYEQDLLGQDDALAMEFDETAGVTDPDAVRGDVGAEYTDAVSKQQSTKAAADAAVKEQQSTKDSRKISNEVKKQVNDILAQPEVIQKPPTQSTSESLEFTGGNYLDELMQRNAEEREMMQSDVEKIGLRGKQWSPQAALIHNYMTEHGMSEEEALAQAMQSDLFRLAQPSSYGSLGQFQASMDSEGRPLDVTGMPLGMIDPRELASFRGNISDLLTDDDIADILMDFDLNAGQLAAPSRRKQDELDQMMIDFGM